MRGGLIGGVCFLAFLLSSGIKGQNLLNSYDQQGETSGITESKSTEVQYEDDAQSKLYSSYPTVDSLAKAEASSEALGQYESASSESQAKAFASSNSLEIQAEPEPDRRSSFLSAHAFAEAFTRVISPSEYVLPHLIPGGENLIVCSRESELHSVWSPVYQCLICVCVREAWTLQAICISCNTCLNPPQPRPPVIIEPPTPVPIFPPPPPTPPPLPPSPPPLPILPPPPPESQVSCSPLPTDLPFQNPLNPCQICICTRIYDSFGQTDIQIQCQENPQCVQTPDITPIPPIPVPPRPVPLPLCERFPPNVPFPHPSDRCKICKCVVEVAYYTPEQKILCIPNPECDILVEPIVPVVPIEEEPVAIPELQVDTYPIIQPEPEPMPWPPMVRPSTPPSPLPGPPPHETCKPYPPNTPFQHPWDDCQICMCSEIYGKNVVNIEVNCYTKKSCCIEPPIPEPVVRPLPLPMYPTSNIIFIEPRCRYQQPQSPFVANCNVCVCQVIYSYVVAQCSPQDNCASPYPLIDSSADASAQATASAYSQDYSIKNRPGLNVIGGSPPLDSQFSYNVGIPGAPAESPYLNLNNLYAPGSLSNELAQSEATAISQSGNLYQYPNYVYSPEVSQSSAIAQANSQSLSSQPSYITDGYPISGLSNAQAQAEATANTQYDNTGLYSQFPYSLTGNSLSSAHAEAEAHANAQYANTPYATYLYSPGGSSLTNIQNAIPNTGLSSYPYSLGQSSANAQAEASAHAQSIPLYGPSQNYLSGNRLLSQQAQSDAQANFQYGAIGSLGSSNLYNTQAQAEAIANAQSGGLLQNNINPYYLDGSQSNSLAQAEAVANSASGSYLSGSYDSPYSTYQVNDQLNQNAIAASDLYSSAYTQPSSINPLYQPETLWGDSSAQAQASAFSGTAQSLAQSAAISGRPLIRSGPGLCKYNGDKYHHNCQACYCFQEATGSLYTLCLGNPCA